MRVVKSSSWSSRWPALVARMPVAQLVGHENQTPISVVHFTADGKYCLTGGHDRTVRLWNPSRLDTAFPPPRRMDTSDRDDNDIPVNDLPRSLCIQTYSEGITHPVSALAVHDQTLIAACDKSLVIHDLVSASCHRRRLGHHTGRINAVAMGAAAETFLTASYDATVKIWDARNSRSYDPIQTLDDAKDSVTDVHVDHLSTHLVRTASVDGLVRTYDLRMGLLTCDDCHVAITSMLQSHDGQCLAVQGLDDATIRLIDLTATATATTTPSSSSSSSSLLLNTFTGSHKAGTYALKMAFTADDLALVTGSDDGTAVAYHAVTAEPVAFFKGHRQPTCAVAASPLKQQQQHNASIITASFDGHAIVWAQNQDYMKWQ